MKRGAEGPLVLKKLKFQKELLEELSAKGLIRPAKARFEDFVPLKGQGKALSQLLNEVR